MTKPRTIPPIRKFMSTTPHTIEGGQSMSQAHMLMETQQIRHLPVLAGGKLVGIITQSDLHLVEALSAVDPNLVRVDVVMTRDVYVVTPDAPLDEVVQEMARHKYGSTIVVDHHTVVGVFTIVDVCRAFAEMLRAG
jgi:acetoin utilization protein AcuB